jgi:glycosyltransferase involved in cell wall biosynthesis
VGNLAPATGIKSPSTASASGISLGGGPRDRETRSAERHFSRDTGVCVTSLRRAKQFGAVTLIDQATLHPAAWQREVLADCANCGLDPNQCERVLPAMQIQRQEQEYKLCDRIIVYSSAARQSFVPFTYAHKVAIVPPGADHHFFTPLPNKQRGDIFRVCYVGRIEAAKGLPYLTEAWKRLALRNAELVLAGRLLPEMAWLQREGAHAGIRLAGILPPQGVVALFQKSNLFVLPSANEGLSLALLEAMSTGLPVIACQDTGAEDCVADKESGLLVPARDADALCDAILWCYEHRDSLEAMGAAARTRIEKEFTLDHYAERLLALYRSVA